jgi:hypothetical protein
MKCACGTKLSEVALGGPSGAVWHCRCGLIYSVSVDIPALHRRVVDLETDVERLKVQMAAITSAGKTGIAEPPPKRWGFWFFGRSSLAGVRVEEPHWGQGAGIPGPRYEQGTKEEMEARLARESWPLGSVEVRELPAELAAMRYEGGP